MLLRTLTLASLMALSANLYAAAALNDAQITKVVMTVDKGESDLGKLAESKTKNLNVKQFAEMMVKDHTEGQKKMSDFVQKSAMTPEDSEKSKTMKTEGDQTKAKLMGLNDKAFDKAYIDSMVSGHKKVLDGIDKELLPSAKNSELKSMLEKKRNTVKNHLSHAIDIQASI
jgi:putative membrane protein